MIKLLTLGLALVLASSCSKAEPSHTSVEPESEHERAPDKVASMHDLPHLETPHPSSGPYKPTASEVPLTEDFAAAAEKRVTPDNYRAELITIEKELSQLKAK